LLQSRRQSSRLRPTPGFFRSTGIPVLFHYGFLVVVAILAVVGAAVPVPFLLVTCVFIFLLAVTAFTWSRQSVKRITLRVEPSSQRAFPGETVPIGFVLANATWLPMTWVRVGLDLPWKLVRGFAPESRFHRDNWQWATSLGAGQTLEWKHGLVCRARGEYRLGPVRLESGDPFGIYPLVKVAPLEGTMLVYPRIVPANSLKLPLTDLFGMVTIRRTLYEDTSQTAGSRDYQSGDSFKRVHWKASARAGTLMTRSYESTTSLKLFLVLAVDGFSEGTPQDDDDFETAVTAVASLASAAYDLGAPIGLVCNASPEIDIPAAAGRGQLLRMLEALARVQPTGARSLLEYVGSGRVAIPPGAAPVMVCRGVEEGTAAANHLARQGFPPILVPVRDGLQVSGIDGIRVVPAAVLGDFTPPRGQQ